MSVVARSWPKHEVPVQQTPQREHVTAHVRDDNSGVCMNIPRIDRKSQAFERALTDSSSQWEQHRSRISLSNTRPPPPDT